MGPLAAHINLPWSIDGGPFPASSVLTCISFDNYIHFHLLLRVSSSCSDPQLEGEEVLSAHAVSMRWVCF